MRVLLAIAVAAIGLGACGGGEAATTAPNTTAGGGGGGGGGGTPSTTVQVLDNSFSPDSVVISPGATVTWNWSGAYSSHNVTFGDGPTSGDKLTGTYGRTFTTAGKYVYTCTIHGPSMRGVVTAQ